MYLERVRRLESEMERVSSGLALVSQVTFLLFSVLFRDSGTSVMRRRLDPLGGDQLKCDNSSINQISHILLSAFGN